MDNPQAETIEPETSVEERLEAALISKEKEAEEPDPEGQTEESADEAEETTEEVQEVVEELFEVEFDGKKAQVPKELKDAFLRQADYSTKTQAVAEQRKQLAQERQNFQIQQQLNEAVTAERTELQGLIATSKQYETALQQAINQGQVDSIPLLNAQYSMLQRQIEEKAALVRSKMGEQHQALQEHMFQRRKQADEEAVKRIPNFNAETKKDLVQAARKLGFDDAEIGQVDDPRVYEALWKAAKWDELQSKSASVKTKVATAPKTLPAKGQPTPVGKAAVTQKARDTLRRTGRPEAAESFIESLLAKRR